MTARWIRRVMRAGVADDRTCPFADGLGARSAAQRARHWLDNGELELVPHPPVVVPPRPDWSADPFGDTNWRYQLHALRWAQGLKRRYDRNGDDEALVRWLEVLADWHERNRWSTSASDQSWGDHATAIRARVYAACAQALAQVPEWLEVALHEHVDVLANPAFYPTGGNHALNQNVGLFAAATILGREAERRHALDRTAELLERSVDHEGVTDEQSTEYQIYNFRRYREAARLFADGGMRLPAVFDRIDRMPEFIAHATLPNGRRVIAGDACDDPSYSVDDTVAEFAATQGTDGPRPTKRVRLFERGWLFARTGWGEHRPFVDEHHLTVRFGPPRIPHGHHDAGALSLYAHGRRIVTGPGKYAYRWDPFRAWVLSRHAQNSLSFPDVPYGPDGGSILTRFDVHDELIVLGIDDHHYPDVELQRTVVFDLDSGLVVVIDSFAHRDNTVVAADQRFRLDPGFAVDDPDGRVVRAAASDGPGLAVTQLGEVDTIEVVTGREPADDNPAGYDGWVSYRYGERTPAPTIITRVTAPAAHVVTVLHTRPDGDPFAATPATWHPATSTLHLERGSRGSARVAVRTLPGDGGRKADHDDHRGHGRGK